MTDSTQVTLPAAKAFLSGKLEMSDSISPGMVASDMTWADYPVNSIAVILFTLLALLTLKSLLNLYPMLLDSLTRWKGCVNIDSSIRLKSDRNLLSLIWLLPIVLVADRYGLPRLSLLDRIPPEWHLSGTLAVLVIWLALRYICYFVCSLRARRQETFRSAHKALFNFLIVLAMLMILTAGIISFTQLSDDTARTIFLYEAAFFYLASLVRERQILGTFCSHFQTFLYLCALEIVPTGALIAANIWL